MAELESEILQLRKALNEARLERDILKKQQRILHGVAEKYALIEQWRQQFPIEAMCQVFGVSRSGYYNWVQHEDPQTENKVMSSLNWRLRWHISALAKDMNPAAPDGAGREWHHRWS
ncbi:hypothetical protein ACULNC_22025 [Shigella flexneri]